MDVVVDNTTDSEGYVFVNSGKDGYMSIESSDSELEFDLIDSQSEDDFPTGKVGVHPDKVPVNLASYHCSEASAWHRRKLEQKLNIADIVKEHVLHFLPAKSLCRFKTVCKDWDQWISSPFLAHKQTNHFRTISALFCLPLAEEPYFISLDPSSCGIPHPLKNFLPETSTLRNSCNGLLCCKSESMDSTYFICNPVNLEVKELPEPNFYHGPESGLALVFEPSVLNFGTSFELVCAFPLTDNPVLCFEIYSSRSGSWRVADCLCCEFKALKLNGDGFYSNNIVYWVTLYGKVLAFDLRTEEYGLISLPPGYGPDGILTEMGRELCYILPRNDDVNVGGYLLEIYGDLNMNLKHRVRINLGDYHWVPLEEMRILGSVNDGMVVILVDRKVIEYDVRTGEVKLLSDSLNPAIELSFARFVPYVNSLVQVGHPMLKRRRLELEEEKEETCLFLF